ncbi:response regulator transcription factor [Crenobacter sp. SG2305]|uniref:response regulator transcription factor n=1 Tax=Crenobacter oryzisoli TaxID=3056844 RepID=UPI0025AB1BEE|nr:response regulator transcription factor [Crenobacter sp. SG2305]MDN0085447.1 response regulator transcription factor [Crenobacter sp. SG2305]
MAKVLLVDDDVELVEMLRDYLVQEAFEVTVAHDGEAALGLMRQERPAIVVLDTMLPRLSGIEVLRRIREEGEMPVLMLTARGSDIDRVVGLELGADDYVAKPCSVRELAARLRAILRRSARGKALSPASPPLEVGRLTLWPAQRRAEWAGRALALTGAEFNILEHLARHASQVVSKAQLSAEGLGRPLERFDRRLDTHVSNLRQKLAAQSSEEACIRTVYRVGYQLIEV